MVKVTVCLCEAVSDICLINSLETDHTGNKNLCRNLSLIYEIRCLPFNKYVHSGQLHADQKIKLSCMHMQSRLPG